MLRIPCPHCGLRDNDEFTYLGDATVVRPDSSDATDDAWQDYVFVRDNPRGVHEEFWHHGHGCRCWIIVTRDTATHKISGARLAQVDRK